MASPARALNPPRLLPEFMPFLCPLLNAGPAGYSAVHLTPTHG